MAIRRLSVPIAFSLCCAAPAAGEAWRAPEPPPPARAAPDLPFTITNASTTWVLVSQACATQDTVGSPAAQTPAHVWCFEGAGGDSSWPAIPPAQDDGSRHSRWDHWSKFAPPEGAPSRWQVTPRHGGAGTGGYNAWCGCDSTGGGACDDVAFWVFKEGYGDDWDYPLTLDMAGQNASAGGSVSFDLRYDCECNYDYVYLEYLQTTTSQWLPVRDGSGRAARFNGVSGNVGTACGDDYFGHSGTLGGQPYYGNSVWLAGVTFPLPAQSGGMLLRWRGASDGAWSDADGSGDTDGLGAIDNVTVTFTASGVTVTDDFETGDFSGVGASSGSAMWIPGAHAGNPYDGWHLAFDPKYKNKGNTCEFSNDWMWSAKPEVGAIPASGFDFLLATPVIDVSGWTAGVFEFSEYWCTPYESADETRVEWQHHVTGTGWSTWTPFSVFDTGDPNCLAWSMNSRQDLGEALGPGVDSLRVGWAIFDTASPGDFAWGNHNGVNWLIDNVSIGRIQPAGETAFSISSGGLFGDTFSRVDPAHTAEMDNVEEGHWSGNGGSRAMTAHDSLGVLVHDPDGIDSVELHWRVGTGTPPEFGAWSSKPAALTAGISPGYYWARTTVGNTTSEDYSADEAGSLANAAKDPVWDPGQIVQYYLVARDVPNAETTFPASASGPDPEYLEFRILPSGRETAQGKRILLVMDDPQSHLDFEHSAGFDAGGGVGSGGFTDPAFAPALRVMERSLASLYFTPTGPVWDLYRVPGAGSAMQREPRVLSAPGEGLGGLADPAGTPLYDLVVWMNGSIDADTFQDGTRAGLEVLLDHGGHLLSSGDGVAWALGSEGAAVDPAFLGEYLGTSFPTAADDWTADRMLTVFFPDDYPLSAALYGECPSPRRDFDKLTEVADVPGVQVATTLALYNDGDAATNGRAAVIRNDRVAGGGIAVHCGFDLTALASDGARVCLLAHLLQTVFGIPTDNACYSVASPEIPPRAAGFALAAPTPSPFSNVTRFSFSIPVRTDVALDIHDVMGRRVRALVRERLAADRHVRTWDGRDDAGKRAPAGIYFVKLKAGEYSASRKVVVLR